jgi:hypothetical protein
VTEKILIDILLQLRDHVWCAYCVIIRDNEYETMCDDNDTDPNKYQSIYGHIGSNDPPKSVYQSRLVFS